MATMKKKAAAPKKTASKKTAGLTAAQKKKFIKASREGDEKTIESFKIKFDEVSQPIELINFTSQLYTSRILYS